MRVFTNELTTTSPPATAAEQAATMPAALTSDDVRARDRGVHRQYH